MEFCRIKNIDQQVSRLCLGTWAIGGGLWGGTDENESIRTIHQAFDEGINILDTAPAYGKGESERIVGKALKGYAKRDKIIIATKFGLNQEGEGVFRDLRKASILKEVEDSLKRLEVDSIDLYQAHWPDTKTPIIELVEALNQLKKDGKVKAFGVCNFTLEQVIEFRKGAELSTLQFPFNIFEQEQQKILDYCKKEKITSMAYSSICRGLLSGKMKKEREFKGDDLRKGMDPKFKQPVFSEYVDAADALQAWSLRKYHRPLLALAERWVLDKGVDLALWGARTPDQLINLKDVFGWKLHDDDFKEIEKIVKEHVKNPVGPDFMQPPERQ